VKKILALIFALITIQPALSSNIFVVGADNSDESIRDLTQINNIKIPEIEDKARPCAYSKWEKCSRTGFLSKNESLIERLLVDNDYVHSKGLTHAQLAEPLIIMRTLPETHCQRNEPTEPLLGGTCTWNGVNFSVELAAYFGVQESIFNDGLLSNVDVKVINTTTGQTFTYSELLVPYIQDYGFYEGDTPYRLSPESIVQMFDMHGA
jgi:hypothetical protein